MRVGVDDLMPSMEWARRGACVGQDPSLFFPPDGVRVAKALAICSTCVVKSECLAYAVATGIGTGVWGGTSAKQRARAKRYSREYLAVNPPDAAGPRSAD